MYRMQNRPAPTKPTPYALAFWEPVAQFIKRQLGEKLDARWQVIFCRVVETCAKQCSECIAQMLANVERQDAAFQKMKKTSGNETMQDKDKIRAQVKLDVEAIQAAACEMVGCTTAESLVLPEPGTEW
jgi:hypothetical protein